MNRHFTVKEVQMAKKHMKRCLVSLPTREMHMALQDVATLVTLNTENRRFVSAQNRVYSCIEIH